MVDNEIELFLSSLVNQQNVAPNTQLQALNVFFIAISGRGFIKYQWFVFTSYRLLFVG